MESTSTHSTQTLFESLPIPEEVMRGIRDAGFEYCTPIQAKTLPLSLQGKDVAGQAQTGTGKTAAFLITMFTHLLKTPPLEIKSPKDKSRTDHLGPRGLIIAPTRELAIQIGRDAELLGRHCNFRIVCIYGGVDYDKQRQKIKDGVDILIVTPGRLIDYYKQRFFSLKSVQVLVVDEADRMFDMGFIDDLRYILRNTSKYNQRLTMLYSATLNYRVMELCYEHMNTPEKLVVEPEKITVDKVKQSLYHVGSHEKFNLLLGLLPPAGEGKVLIFCNTKEMVEKLEAQLLHNKFSVGQISGDIHQRKRQKVLEDFTEGRLEILIATDVASRGIHVDDITHVINYDLPQDPEDYVHRIGRTARAGADGTAISLSCEDYVVHLERIEEMLKRKLPVEWPDEKLFVQGKEGGPKILLRRRRPPTGNRPPRNGRPSGKRPVGKPNQSRRGSRPRR